MTIATPASSFWLDDGLVAFAPTGGGTQVGYGKVAGSFQVIDLGTTPWKGVVAINTTAVNAGGGRTFTFEVEGSNTSDFSGAKQILMSWQPQAVEQDPRQLLSVYDDVHYRYIRLRKTVTGTTPSITALVFIRSLSDLTAFTLGELITIQSVIADNIANQTRNMRQWMATPASTNIGSGPGMVPVSDGLGNTVISPSLPKIIEDSLAAGVVMSDPNVFANKQWQADRETSPASLAERMTTCFVGVSYDGRPPALGIGGGYDDYPGIQAAMDYAAATGQGMVEFDGTKRYHLSEQIVQDPTRVSMQGNGCSLIWDLKDTINPTSMPELSPLNVGWQAGTLTQLNLWKVTTTTLSITPPGPNLLLDPTYANTPLRYGILNAHGSDAVWNVSGTSYGATTDVKGFVHSVEYVTTTNAQAGQTSFAEVVDIAPDGLSLKAFPCAEFTRYCVGVHPKTMTGVATGLHVAVDFYKADGTYLGTGYGTGYPTNATSVDGWVYTIVDSPQFSAFASHRVICTKSSGTSGAALISWDKRFCRAIDVTAYIYPGYIDAGDNQGAYGDIGVRLPGMITYPLDPATGYTTYLAGSRIKEYLIKFTITSLTREGAQKYLGVGLRAYGIGLGGGPYLTFSGPGDVEWQIACPEGVDPLLGCWLTFQSNNEVTIDLTSLSIKELPDTAVWRIESPHTSAQFDQTPHFIQGFRLVGRASQAPWTDCFVFASPEEPQSSRISTYNVETLDFANGVVVKRQSYLFQFYNCFLAGYHYGVKTIANVEDAGEEISFYGCTFTGGSACLYNGEHELRVYGSSLDYPVSKKYVINGGTVEGFGIHLEGQKPDAADAYPITSLGGGQFIMWGGRIEINGFGSNEPPIVDHFFKTYTKYGRISLHGVQGYHWKTTTGYLKGGPGRLSIDFMQGGSEKLIDCFLGDDDQHNAFGAGGRFEGSQIAIPMWVDGGDVRVSPREVHYSGASGAYTRAQLTTADYVSGTKCLEIVKSGIGHGTSSQFTIAMPIRHCSMVGFRFKFKTIPPAGQTGIEDLYMQCFFAQLLPTADSGVFQFGDSLGDGFFGEQTVRVDQSAASSWLDFEMSTARSDESTVQDGYAPEWATHAIIVVSMYQQRDGFTMRIDNLMGSVM